MAEPVIVAFDEESAAQRLMDEIAAPEGRSIVQLQDAAVITRDVNGKYFLKQAVDVVAAGALGGAFWGLLVGLLLLVPFVGAAGGALSGKLADIGIAHGFIETLGNKLPPGKSAAIFVVQRATPDNVFEAFASYGGTIVQSSLTADAQARLQAVLNC